ncbi:endonuclease domain-containing protein [Streptomyces sp. NPDC047718]|uniref:endonuclease domain-containing protein n=1 Tax=Streptomyces sp. NPDC047718 TaxID=3155479 RepID=UPI0033C761A2
MTKARCTFTDPSGDCTKEVSTRGFCQQHYDHLRRRGLLPVLQKRQSTEGPCDFPGCPEDIYANRLCNPHWQQSRKRTTLVEVGSWKIPEGALCTAAPTCDRPQYSLTLCRTHYDQRSKGRALTVLPAPRPSPDGSCEAPACTRTAENPARGDRLCLSHGIMQRRGSALAPLITRTPTERLTELIARGVYWCTVCQQELPLDRFIRDHKRNSPRSRCRSCSGMLTRANKFNISFADLARLFTAQDHLCALCRAAAEHIDGLNLDHDHACCPDRGTSCGRCIRGLLCWNCNAGVVTWYERLRGTVPPYSLLDAYLDDPPAARFGLTDRTPQV